ncbi:hypothetical protein CLIB1444_06S04390 [[Candida] jaroonii]|uniref:Uncharacterized protein n=1 Tax=[Candida] jaroonii TaxID=467808 RepID=A0ACA9YA13_9ASCO|nr:hypothetical protein CLIB1444_06S04390 [[Candida] jaroonii]
MGFAITCPGQGVLKNCLLKPYLRFPIKNILNDVNESLGYDFTRQLIDNDELWLKNTANAQPAIFTITYLIANICTQHLGLRLDKASVILGHSLGEYSALCLNGTLSLSTTIRLVTLRGKLMEKLQNDRYGMKILMLRPDKFDKIQEYCLQKEVLANINNHQQITISGFNEKLDQIIQDLKSKKLIMRSTELPVKIPFHSPQLSVVEPELSRFLDSEPINPSTFPLITNLTGEMSHDINDTISVNSKPVNWVKSINSLQQLEISDIINLGPSQVLYNLNKKFPYQNHILDELTSSEITAVQSILS